MQYRRLRVSGATYFFTVITHNREKLFADAQAVEMFRDATEAVRLHHRFSIEAEVILPDHIHCLWSLPDGDSDFSTRWMLIKSRFSRSYRQEKLSGFASGLTPTYGLAFSRESRGERPIWQHRFWEHLIRDERDFSAHIEYIHYNPVKHGYVKAPIDWPHSTFRSFVDLGRYDAHWGSDEMPKLPDWAGME